MQYLIVLAVIAAASYVISSPFRAERRQSRRSDGLANRRAELEAARDAKYTEIRDAELDLRTGKLSDEDYAAIDGGLRAEAIAIMHALDRVEAEEAGAAEPSAGAAEVPPGP